MRRIVKALEQQPKQFIPIEYFNRLRQIEKLIYTYSTTFVFMRDILKPEKGVEVGGVIWVLTVFTGFCAVMASYPQIIHSESKDVTGGVITYSEFVDVNGKQHEGRIPAVRLG